MRDGQMEYHGQNLEVTYKGTKNSHPLYANASIKTNYVYGCNPGDGNGTEKFPSSNVKVGTLK